MSYTKEYTATNGAWTTVIDGQTSGAIQLKDDGPVLVHIGASAPAADSEEAFELARDEGYLRGLNFTSLEGTDKVFVRSRHNESNKVVATSTGSAPA